MVATVLVEVWITVRVLENPAASEVNEISYPVGAVMVISDSRFVPDTVRVCVAEAWPVQTTNGVRVPTTVSAGTPGPNCGQFLTSAPSELSKEPPARSPVLF